MFMIMEGKGEGLKNLFILGTRLLTQGKVVFYSFISESNNVTCINRALRREGKEKQW